MKITKRSITCQLKHRRAILNKLNDKFEISAAFFIKYPIYLNRCVYKLVSFGSDIVETYSVSRSIFPSKTEA